MKVILLEDVKALGRADDIVEVSRGYAVNMLFKKNLAVEATPENLNSVKNKKKAKNARMQKDLEQARKIAEEMESKVFTIKAKCGEGERLYGAVTSIDIAKAISEQGYDVDKRGIETLEPVKSIGTYDAKIKLHKDVIAKIKINVVPLD